MNLSSVDLELLRAFLAVAREGSVSRAAERLHLSQPAVSLQLKRLAEATSLQLFTRTARGLALTAEGGLLVPQAARVIDALADFRRSAEQMGHTVRGSLRIGTILDPEFTRLGAFLRYYTDSAPHVETKLQHGMSGTVLAMVTRGDLDVGFYLGAPAPENTAYALGDDISSHTLTVFQYRVVAPAGWEAQVLGRDWGMLGQLPWLGTPEESVHHRLQASIFGSIAAAPRRVAQVDQEASMLDLLKAGIGLSLVRDSIAINESRAHGLVIADKVHLDCALQFIWLKAREADPPIARALSALERVWGTAGLASGKSLTEGP